MLEKYVGIGNKVELQVRHGILTEEEEKALKIYVSKINQVLDEDKIEILMPIEQSHLVLLPRNEIFTMVIYTKKGLYQCDVKIQDRYKNGNVMLQSVELISPLKRYQRREFYRYNCNIPVFTRSLSDEEKEMLVWDETIERTEGWTQDIGGGGIRFRTVDKYELHELILCILHIELKEEARDVEAIGKVLAIKPVKDSELYEMRLQFKRISHRDREWIIHYIFEDERKRRKRDNGL